MTAIWKNDGEDWRLLVPAAFPDEKTLHTLVEEAPQLLPLAGKPKIVIVGREVQLGTGYADLIGIEPNGRLVVLEVKLARNAEARRAVVSQVLSYAAFIFGLDPASLERNILKTHLRKRGYESLANAIASADQEGDYDAEEFEAGLVECLAEGRFRLVLILDEVPDELVRLVGYLESISDRILIDLVSIASYEVGGSKIIVPQRVDPERSPQEHLKPESVRKSKGHLEEGADDFIAKIPQAKPESHELLHKLANWAVKLEENGLCRVSTYHGVNDRYTLLPRLFGENVGLVTIWNDGNAYLQFWRSVFERLAPNSLANIEQLIAPMTIKQGNTTSDISDELLRLLAAAYREANGQTI